MNADQLITDLARLGISIEAHGDRLRYSPRSAVTPDLASRMKAHKAELLAILRSIPVDPGSCPDCGGSLQETLTFDGFLNLECPSCDRCFGCRPSTDEVAARFSTRSNQALQVCEEDLDVIGEVKPCLRCGSFELYQAVTGDWQCLLCDPRTTPNAVRAAEIIPTRMDAPWSQKIKDLK